MRLILVDDEAGFLVSASTALKGRGIDVTTAQSGRMALELLNNERFDVAVLDLKMPEMAGDVLFREIKKRWPDMPVIILTGYGTLEQVGQFSKEGVFYYLRKPCDIEHLARVARQSASIHWRKWLRRLRTD